MLTGASRDKHAATEPRALTQALLRRAVRQAALVRVGAAGLAHAPTLDDRLSAIERARERLLQLELAADCYAELTGADLVHDAEQLLGSLDAPSSWLEASLAQLLLCLAARVEMEAADPTDILPDALAYETEHVHAARAALHELGALHPSLRARLCDVVPRWLTIAYGSLEPAQASAFTSAIEMVFQPLGIHISH